MPRDKSKIIPITALRRNFGVITADLPRLESLILTKGGKPFAILRAAPEEKKKVWRKAAGSWKGTSLDDDAFWKMALKKKSRKGTVSL